jgi:ribosomal protein S19E (S16A)
MDRAAELLANIDKLQPHQQDFARSLAQQLQRKGSLSEKQWPHFDRLHIVATGKGGTAEPVKSSLAFPRIVEMFRAAFAAAAADGEGFIWPKLKLAANLSDNEEKPNLFRFRIHKSASGKHAGTYQVKEDKKRDAQIFDMGSHAEQAPDDRRWFGRIELDGTFVPSFREQATPEYAAIVATLSAIQADPNAAMKVQGQRTKQCCMCGRTLTNAVSRARGIGPICGAKFGL